MRRFVLVLFLVTTSSTGADDLAPSSATSDHPLNRWVKLSPLAARTFRDDNAGKSARRYYLVAVDALGQEGFPPRHRSGSSANGRSFTGRLWASGISNELRAATGRLI